MSLSPTMTSARPGPAEHSPYYSTYIALVPDDELDVVGHLADQHHETVGLLRKSKAKADHSYGPGKWTVKEVIGHLSDTERIFAYRALRFARGDKTDLPGFDENAYVPASNASSRTIDELIEELWSVRAATLSLAKQLKGEVLTRQGSANGNGISVRALLYIIAGHERHHVAILRERYGL